MNYFLNIERDAGLKFNDITQKLGEIYLISIFNDVKDRITENHPEFQKDHKEEFLNNLTSTMMKTFIKHEKVSIEDLERYLYEQISISICELRKRLLDQTGVNHGSTI